MIEDEGDMSPRENKKWTMTGKTKPYEFVYFFKYPKFLYMKMESGWKLFLFILKQLYIVIYNSYI